jgi:hypothetical protein
MEKHGQMARMNLERAQLDNCIEKRPAPEMFQSRARFFDSSRKSGERNTISK